MPDRKLQDEIIKNNRYFTKAYRDENKETDDLFESDQQLMKPQPPLTKTPMVSEENRISLTLDFSKLALNNDIVSVIRDRHSHRAEDIKEEKTFYKFVEEQGL